MLSQRVIDFASNYSDAQLMTIECKKSLLLAEIIQLKEEQDNKELWFPNQQQAANSVYANIAENKEVLFHFVLGPTQAGKTGCMLALIHACLSTGIENIINPCNIFIITGLSSNDWVEQTKNRMPDTLRANVFHRGQLDQLQKALLNKDGSTKRDVLIIIDELHLASKEKMTIDKKFTEIGLKDIETLVANNINLVEFTATPNGHLTSLEKWDDARFGKVILAPAAGYTSSKTLLEQGHVHRYEDLWCVDDIIPGDTEEKKNQKQHLINKSKQAITDLKTFIETTYTEPKYHIIRNQNGDKGKCVDRRFSEIFGGDYNYLHCNSNSNIREIKSCTTAEPEKHTFIFIKEHLRCAVTLEDKEKFGVLYERVSAQIADDAIIQGLLGRACGYNSSIGDNGIHVFTNVDTVERYNEFYESDYDLNSNIGFRGCNTKNPKKQSRVDPKVFTHVTDGDTKEVEVVKKVKEYESIYEDFTTLDEANKFMKKHKCSKKTIASVNKATDEHGFIHSSTSGKKKVLNYSDVKKEIAGWHETSNMSLPKNEEKGKTHGRFYIVYKDTQDVNSVVFICRVVKKL